MITFALPIRIVSEANCSEHWTKKSKRHKQQQYFTRLAFNQFAKSATLPCTVRLIRLSSRLLDDDNLVCAFKWIRDEISECLIPDKSFSKDGKKIKGRADCDERIKWLYDQNKSKNEGFIVEIDF